ncbi:MAG TPA: hypothetical protein VFX40_03010, partial [Gemmatimonadaceae bacterium]|nr:hypothetical protein [Gemmatimonadaceae bacterium]
LRMRSLLGGSETVLPEADSLVNWDLLEGAFVVTAMKDGSFTWRASSLNAGVDTLPKAGPGFVRRALEDVASQGERLMWPESFEADSALFEITLKRPIVRKGGQELPLKARLPFPVFTLEVPWQQEVHMTKEPRIDYPESLRRAAIAGGVQLQFVIDEKGKIVPGSIREAWPDSRPRLTGFSRDYYRDFVKAVERGLPSARFSPAIVGGCVRPQRVMQIFNFAFRE